MLARPVLDQQLPLGYENVDLELEGPADLD